MGGGHRLTSAGIITDECVLAGKQCYAVSELPFTWPRNSFRCLFYPFSRRYGLEMAEVTEAVRGCGFRCAPRNLPF